ncbi:hypothetical protein, partial [Mesorhizobium sp. M7A.F.Ca.CA.001.10.2.1]|uniref:hypothetical protein n=1 Tax=Mesorhizobium sp. M7A.F.Ca.CA.001.10.2.1 TaxID=2496720 RepID=UPI0019D03270
MKADVCSASSPLGHRDFSDRYKQSPHNGYPVPQLRRLGQAPQYPVQQTESGALNGSNRLWDDFRETSAMDQVRSFALVRLWTGTASARDALSRKTVHIFPGIALEIGLGEDARGPVEEDAQAWRELTVLRVE